jgi:hypothetical protein
MALPMGGEVGDIGGLAGRCGRKVHGLPADAGPFAARRIETKTLQPIAAQLALRFRHHGVGAVAVDLAVGDPGAFNATGLEIYLNRQIAPRRVVADTAVTVADLGRGACRSADLGGGAAGVIVGQAAQGARRIAGDVAGRSDCRIVGGDSPGGACWPSSARHPGPGRLDRWRWPRRCSGGHWPHPTGWAGRNTPFPVASWCTPVRRSRRWAC